MQARYAARRPGAPQAEEDVVLRLRSAVDAVGTDVLVGGGTAVVQDIKTESARDTRVIIPRSCW